ncbi:MAG: CoA-binding protein [Gemmatimonadota bacterium]|nr:CoA-binding protein [Gemmatimonadota bacterium]
MSADVRRILESARTIAVLGAHPGEHRPAHYVPAYLKSQGYRILPVNPRFAGTELFGETVTATLAELDAEVDLVDVFRRPEHLPQHDEDLRAMDPRPAVIWLQAGIRHDPLAAQWREAGFEVVQDRCTLADHRRLGIGPVS